MNNVVLINELKEFLDGELLGDGHLNPVTYNGIVTSVRYQHGSSKKRYLQWLGMVLTNYGIKRCGNIRKRLHEIPTSKSICIDYHYCSKSYRELVSYYSRWYPNRKKIVPKDLKLTPVTVRQWYIGDGSIYKGTLFFFNLWIY